jgi:hypothetical protein
MTVHPIIHGFVGWSGGEVFLTPEDEYDPYDPLVLERPELFDADILQPEVPLPVKRGPGRPPGSRNRPKS